MHFYYFLKDKLPDIGNYTIYISYIFNIIQRKYLISILLQ